SRLMGAFNVSNLTDLLKTAARLQPVCGRMEVFTAPGKPTVVVDYAHTPDALEKALPHTPDALEKGAPALRRKIVVRLWLWRGS
ncbi:UDP-N-acetylmuramoylalanyl-D-glutamate, partial [Salmonella enterica subsp. enterica serovar Give str. S5-487]